MPTKSRPRNCNGHGIEVTVHLGFRHAWLGRAFIHLCTLPCLLGVDYSEKACDRIARVALWLMSPRTIVRPA